MNRHRLLKHRWLLCFLLLPYAMSAANDEVAADTTQLQWLGDKAFARLMVSDFDGAIHYGRRLLDEGTRRGDTRRAVPQAHLCLGQAYTMKGDDAGLAFEHLQQAERYAHELHNDTLLASVCNALGLYETNIDKDYYSALQHYQQSRDLSEELSLKAGIALADANIAGIYYLKKDAAGICYAEECYEIGHELRVPRIIFMGASMLSFLYYLDGNLTEAMNHVQEAEFLMEENEILDQTNIYTHHGRLLLALGRYADARHLLDKALAYRDQSQLSSIMDACCTYGQLLRADGDLTGAIAMLCEGVALSDSLRNEVYRGDLLKELALCYELAGDTGAALLIYKRYMAADDSLYRADKEREMEEIRARYHLEQSENAARESQLQVMRKQRYIGWLLTAVVLIGVVALMMGNLYSRKNRLYRSIVRQNMDALQRERTLQQRLEICEQKLAALHNPAASEGVTDKYASSPLTTEKKDELYCRLEALMTDRAIYRDKLLTKDRVAELLGTNRTYLSQVINERTNLTFTGYINSIRIHEAVRVLSDPTDDTPLKVLFGELGYSSITTFYKQFQASTGMTPSQFRDKATAMVRQSTTDNIPTDSIDD